MIKTILIIAYITLSILCLVLLVAKDYYKEELEKQKQVNNIHKKVETSVLKEKTYLQHEIGLYQDTIETYKKQLDILEEKIDQLQNQNNLPKECEEIKPIKILKITTNALLNKNALIDELEFFKMQVEKYGYIIETPPYQMEVIEITPVVEAIQITPFIEKIDQEA